MACEKELRSVKGVTLAEAQMSLRRYEQWFYSSEGSDIHQTRFITGVGYNAFAFAGTEIQKRSYPNSFGGQYQNKGYELIDELRLVENAKRIGEEIPAISQEVPSTIERGGAGPIRPSGRAACFPAHSWPRASCHG